MAESFLVGIENKQSSKVISTPSGFENPPEKILCSQCGNIVEGKFKTSEKYIECLNIPCNSYEISEPFIACDRCNFPFKNYVFETCQECKISTNYKCKFCPSCGKERSE
jgi:hypothetical protein